MVNRRLWSALCLLILLPLVGGCCFLGLCKCTGQGGLQQLKWGDRVCILWREPELRRSGPGCGF